MEFKLTATFNATAKKIYDAWLDGNKHTAMTGGEANTSRQIGDEFDAWNGYIQGTNLELTPNKKIVQSWRTSEFEEHEEDSKIEITLEEIEGKTELTLTHSNLGETGEQYKKGWQEHYFEPMKAYFSENLSLIHI